MVEQIHGAKEQLLQLWHSKQAKLDQCFQLRHFEQDCKKVCKKYDIYIFVCQTDFVSCHNGVE